MSKREKENKECIINFIKKVNYLTNMSVSHFQFDFIVVQLHFVLLH
jgi:hypothetical protein